MVKMWPKFALTFLLLFILCTCITINAEKDQSELMEKAEIIEQRFYKEYLNYMETGVRSKALLNMFKALQAPEEIRKFQMSLIEDQTKITALCLACRATLNTGFNMRRVLNMQRDQLIEVGVNLCISLNIQDAEVCRGAIELNVDAVLFAVDHQPALTPQVACAMLLQGDCGSIDAPEFDFVINVDKNADTIRGHKELEGKGENTFKIVHISDIHYDPNYRYGNVANCDQPTCCRQKQGLPENPEDGAGFWGSYPCDTPWNAVDDALQHISETHSDAKYFYNTGDQVDHGVWETTAEGNIQILTQVDDAFVKYWGHLPGQIIQALGNHEGQPVNVFSPEDILTPNLTMNWLYSYAETSWRRFGLPPSTAFTIKRGGYYTFTPYPGFRIITLNDNVCYNVNWWNYYNTQALTVQLDWLHDTLLEAERAGEKVHILLHMPSGNPSCYRVWSREYTRIVQRFYKTISAQFNGHTHKDELCVYYDKENTQYSLNVAWNGGSITTYTSMNPNYRVYTVDADTLEILESESWFYNLTLANLTPGQRPKWEKLYDFREAYGLNDLSPKILNDMIYKFAEDKSLLTNYWQHKVKMGDNPIRNGCSDNCLKNHLCSITVTETQDTRKCAELRDIFDVKYGGK